MRRYAKCSQVALLCRAWPLESHAGAVLAELGGMSVTLHILQKDFCATPHAVYTQ